MGFRSRFQMVVVVCIAGVLFACSGETPQAEVDCEPGYLDINGECKLLCQTDADCSNDEMCSESGYCIPDDGSRCSEDNCGVCDNDPTNDCVQDCAGAWGGNSTEDACGSCDDDASNDCVEDCAGTMGGSATEDECGVCDSDSSNDCLEDCAGVWGGAATVDNCGECDDDTSNDDFTCEQDCEGTWAGTATTDECGVCDDDASNDCVEDCAGTWGGDAVTDECGACDNDASNDCVQDCADTWGGSATSDECGTCDADPSNDCQADCAGEFGGSSYYDDCGVCDAESSNDNATCSQDCEGTWDGAATTDDCGVCDTDSSNDNATCDDCNGVANGTAVVDDCGVCDDDPSNDCCSGNWTTWTGSDCGGGAGASPTSCVDGVVVDAADLCPGDETVVHGQYGRTLTFNSVNLNGSGSDMATVAPGASVSLSVAGNVVDSESNCGSCITQFYVRLDGIFSLCLGSETSGWTFSESTTFTAPSEPGVYYINPTGSWQFNCVDGTGVSTALSDSTIATLVVEGTSYCSDGHVGWDCNDCTASYFAVGSDCAACPGSVPPLVHNGSGEDGDLSGWNVTANGGDGWLRSAGGYDATDGYFRTSYGNAARNQVIDLIAEGYTETELDSAPPITVGEYYKSFFTAGDPYSLTVELRDANGSVMQSYSSSTIASTSEWTWAGDTFTGYGAGLRYIYIADTGVDVEYWGGHYGTVMDAAQVRVALEASNACSGNGVCSAGTHGDGHCDCDAGWSGPNCGIQD